MMINLNLNKIQTSFYGKNDKLLKSLEYRANLANYRAPELSDFYNNSAKFLNKEIKKKEFLKKTSDSIEAIYNKKIELNREESCFFRNITQTLVLIGDTNKIPTEYLKRLLKLFRPIDRE